MVQVQILILIHKQHIQTSSNPINRLNGIASKVGNFGQGLSNTGSFLSNNLSSGIGTGMQNTGNAIKTGANAVQKILPTSKNLINMVGSKIASAIGSGAASAGAGAATSGAVAGGLSATLTGNPLYGLGMANKFANNRMNSDLFQQILKNQGVDAHTDGIITSDDMQKILAANKYQKGFMTRKDYDRMRLENGLITIEEYNQNLSSPDYNPDEMINITGLEAVSKAGRNAQQNKNDKSANYYRSKNEGKNVIKVEYGEKTVQQNQTHVTYGAKPIQQSTTNVVYSEKPKSKNTSNGKSDKKNDTPRVKVQSPDGKTGSVPASQLLEAIKRGFKKL